MSDSKSGARQQRPAFQFYVNDYLTSEHVLCMSWIAKGVFVEMLCMAWNNVGLPADHSRIARMLRMPECEFADLMSGPLGDCWEEVDGRLVNARQERERARLDEIRDVNAEKGRRSGEARRKGKSGQKTNSGSTPVQTQTNSGSTAVQPETNPGSDSVQPRLNTQPSPAQPNPVQNESTHAPARVPEPGKLEKALAEQLATVPDEVAHTLHAWRDHLLERTGRDRGVSYWRGELNAARRDPPAYADRVGFSISKDAKSVLSPKADELAAWKGEQAPTGSNVDPRSLSYGVQDRLVKADDERRLEEWAARKRGDAPASPQAAPAPRVLDVGREGAGSGPHALRRVDGGAA